MLRNIENIGTKISMCFHLFFNMNVKKNVPFDQNLDFENLIDFFNIVFFGFTTLHMRRVSREWFFVAGATLGDVRRWFLCFLMMLEGGSSSAHCTGLLSFMWHAQYLVGLEGDTCCYAQCNWRFKYDEDHQSWEMKAGLRGKRNIYWGWKATPSK